MQAGATDQTSQASSQHRGKPGTAGWAAGALSTGTPPPAPQQHPSRPLLDYIFQEGSSEVVIGNVACVEEQPPIWTPFLGSGQGDLAVLHHLVDTIHSAHHTNGLCGVGLLNHLPNRSTVREKPPKASDFPPI